MDKKEETSNFILEFNSFKLGSSDKWCPKVLIKDLTASKTIPLLWDISLSSEEAANEYAYNKINTYLDENLYADQS